MLNNITKKVIDTKYGKFLSMIVKAGKWEFREDVNVPDGYKIDKDSEQYRLCKKRLIANVRSKIPHYAG